MEENLSQCPYGYLGNIGHNHFPSGGEAQRSPLYLATARKLALIEEKMMRTEDGKIDAPTQSPTTRFQTLATWERFPDRAAGVVLPTEDVYSSIDYLRYKARTEI